MTRRQAHATAAIAAALAAWIAMHAAAQDKPAAAALPEVLRLIPADAPAAIVVPNLKYCSDHFTRLLEGMDRANVLLGSRPIDQFKSVTGFTTGIEDTAAAAVIMADARTAPPMLVALLPCGDVQAFLAANFTGRDGEAFVRGNGVRMFAREINSHVALCRDQAALQAFTPGAGSQAALAADLDDGRALGIDSADAIVVIRQPAIAAFKQRAMAQAAASGARLPALAVLAMRLADELDCVVITLQADPLGLIVRGMATFREGSTFGAHATTPTDNGGNGILLSGAPRALSLIVDLQALGGEAMLRDIAVTTGASIPQWLAQASSLQVAIAPNPAGARGGMLNETAIILRGGKVESVRAAFKHDVLAAASEKNPRREAKWIDDQAQTDGSKADAWEIRTLDAPPELAQAQMFETLLVGSAGMRGFAQSLAPDALAITLSQRPALLSDLARDAKAARENPSTSLTGAPALKVMRQWMPAQRDVEGYIGMGQISSMVRERLQPLGLDPAALHIPEFDAGLPPVGLAMDIFPRHANAAMIVPAGVLAPLFDEVMRLRPLPRDAAEKP